MSARSRFVQLGTRRLLCQASIDFSGPIGNKLFAGKPQGSNSLMQRVLWYVLAALLGSVLLIASTWVIYPQAPKLTPDNAFKQEVARFRPGGQRCQAEVIRRLKIPSRIERRAADCLDAEQKQRDQSNSILEARRAADAASASAVSAFEQTRIAALSLSLGALTMIAAIAAAWYARQAAEGTKQSNVAYQSAARPVVVISLANFKIEALWLTYDIVCANVGGTGCVVEKLAFTWRPKDSQSSIYLGSSCFKPIPSTAEPVVLRSDTVMLSGLLERSVIEMVVFISGAFISESDKAQRFAFEVSESSENFEKAHFHRVEPMGLRFENLGQTELL
ncbi:hypothetical protein [Sphingomonas faeni]|uniref:hypothetical protein n=1 Tax=Sphingomonas faeni TaxID=185950 RepID=UPI0020BD89DB|nr:hypothetical protein [Sphingomonas faeni]MCK8457036.1 hypothetical protein [Sphingomonas faeni]